MFAAAWIVLRGPSLNRESVIGKARSKFCFTTKSTWPTLQKENKLLLFKSLNVRRRGRRVLPCAQAKEVLLHFLNRVVKLGQVLGDPVSSDTTQISPPNIYIKRRGVWGANLAKLDSMDALAIWWALE